MSPRHPIRSARTRSLRFVTVLVAALALFAGVAHADGHNGGPTEEEVAHVKYRQALMGAVGANMGGISGILKNRLSMPGHVESHARQLAESAALVAAAFEKRVTKGATDSKPEIWSDWSGFEAAIADFEKASRGLEKAAASGDPKAIGPAVKALGKSCGGCHESFRKPKEESYKKR